jgi:hypothetical protein
MQINSPSRPGRAFLRASRRSSSRQYPVTITTKEPSPADDTPMRHAGTGQPFIGITNEEHIGKISDG